MDHQVLDRASGEHVSVSSVCLSVCLTDWLTDSMNDASIDILLPTDLLLIVVFVDTRWLERSNCECRCRYHLFSVWCRETPVIASSVLILWIWCMMYSEQNYWFHFLSVPNNQLIVLCADVENVQGEKKCVPWKNRYDKVFLLGSLVILKRA